MGWSMLFDEENSCHYYYNEVTGTSQWDTPTSAFSTSGDVAVRDNYSDVDDNNSDIDLDPLSIVKSDILVNYYSDIDSPAKDEKLSHDQAATDVLPDRVKTNYDYIKAAKQYKKHRKYLDINCSELCVLCKIRRVSEAFFPCNHRCVCHDCVITYDICEYSVTYMMSEVYSNCHFNCPLCESIIKKILPMENGDEVEKYWQWCNEVVIPLPNGFEKRFMQIADALKKVYIDDVLEDNMRQSSSYCSQVSTACVVS